MRKNILLTTLFLLMALTLIAFKSGKNDPRVLTPDVAALVVASKPILNSPGSAESTAELLNQKTVDTEVNAGAYLDSDTPDNSDIVAENTIEAWEQTDESGIRNPLSAKMDSGFRISGSVFRS